MSESLPNVDSLAKRLQARGCAPLFFVFITVVGACFGAGLGVFAFQMERAKAQIATLDQFRPRVGSKVYADGGATKLGEYNVENRQLIRLSEMPLILQKAVVAGEDALFYEHKGVRPDAMFNTVLYIAKTGRVRGGSTITMQLVRNAEEATGISKERTATRKLREMIAALQVEREFTKDEILELYLNQVFFGGSAHGVEAAARMYFFKSCKDLTLTEAATLAGILGSPNAFRPDLHPEAAQVRRNLVLDRMIEHGFITREEYDEARARPVTEDALTPAELAEKLETAKNLYVPNEFDAPYFVREMKVRAIREGLFDDETLLESGYEINTTLDMRLQRAAEEALFAQLKKFDELKLKSLQRARREDEFVPVQGALVCIDNREGFKGYVRALVGGRDWDVEQYNMATQALRQPGSSVKPFVFATALEFGRDKFISPATIRMDEPFVIRRGASVWAPKNFSGDYSGAVTLRYALERSINVVSVKLVQEFGVENVKATIEKCFPEVSVRNDVGLTIGLGTNEVTVLDQCSAYQAIACGGMYTKPIFIESIKDRDGIERYRCEPEHTRVMSEDVSYVLRHMLVGVAEYGTGARTRELGRPRAGKTGTTNDARDVWFCGFTPEYTCIVWIGYKDNRSLGRGADFTGGRQAVPVWTNFMKAALDGEPVQDFVVPEGKVEWHNVSRQKSGGSQGGFKEAFVKGTYREYEPTPESTDIGPDDIEAIEQQMEQRSLAAMHTPSPLDE
ncbi:MAG: PBP1A family penicillin-binding protein [Candidatus Hydrogenedentes bacterium]|nr:PBP1A family penicillin-binding protein [Candidatus Hydrogenedentota bacterium]